MSKHLASKPHVYGKRKRKKNGVSVSRRALGLVNTNITPNNFPLMPVRSTNVEDPTSVRRSTVPVLPELLLRNLPVPDTTGEDFAGAVPVVDSIPERPKRKQANTSVSCNATSDWVSSGKFSC